MSEPGFEEVGFEAAGGEPKPLKTRHVLAAVIGNALEFYDFTIYATFAISIGHAFFPDLGEYLNLTLSLLVFGAGSSSRRFGDYVIGAYGHSLGLKLAIF